LRNGGHDLAAEDARVLADTASRVWDFAFRYAQRIGRERTHGLPVGSRHTPLQQGQQVLDVFDRDSSELFYPPLNSSAL
jgi:hypothetical protein